MTDSNVQLDARLVRGIRKYAIFRIDPHGTITSWNEGVREVLGYEEDEWLGHPAGIMFIPEDRERGEPERELGVAAEVGQADDDRWHLRKDGSRVWVNGSVPALRDEGGALSGFVKVMQDKTEQHEAVEALRESQERYRALVNASTYVVYRMSPDWSEMRQLDGHGFLADTTRVSGSWLEEYIHPSDQEGVLQAIGEAISTKSMFELEHRVIRVDGSLGWTLSRAVPLLDDDGEVVEWFGAASDVTARKETEAALAESEERYRTLFESIDEGFCVIEVHFGEDDRPVDYRFLGVNPAFEGQTGLVGAVGERMRELRPDHEEHWFEVYGRVALTGEPVRFENRAQALRGGVWYDVNAFPVGRPEDHRVGILFNDITQRKQAEAAVRELTEHLEELVAERTGELARSESRFREVFESAPIPILLTTLKDIVVEVNPAFERMTGYGRDEVVGRDARGLGFWSSPQDQKLVREALRDAEGFRDVELQVRSKDGRTLDILMSATRVDSDGERGLVKMFLDITERKRTERHLQQALQEVMQDTSWLAHRVMEKLAQTRGEPGETKGLVADLTPREREVLSLIAAGRSNEAIAEKLGLAPTTIRNYVTNIYTKIGANSRAEAVVWARERGLGGL